ncbi:MAG: hypothetical protein KC933_08030 [Myxococcales bacterium]|nr:hypothetical protein [Myxococcales bacterium]
MSEFKKTLLFTAFSLLFAVVALELVSFAVAEMKSFPNDRPFVARTVTHDCDLDGVDALFGYEVGACRTPDFLTLREGLGFYYDGQTQASAPTILTLGGSTTDPVVMSKRSDIGFDTWPKYLADRCREGFEGCRVVNAGRAAFTSSQELLALVRDGTALAPKVVISLNGINEFYAFKDEIFREHPYVTKQQRAVTAEACDDPGLGDVIAHSRFLPNTRSLVRATQYKLQTMAEAKGAAPATPAAGPKDRCHLTLGLAREGDMADPVKQWTQNVRSMEALARANGARYLVFLQPTLGVGKYVPADEGDLALWDEMMKVRGEYGSYHETINALYGDLRVACRELDFCVDLTDLFEGQSGPVYSDARHPNRSGNQLQAKAIWPEVEAILKAPSVAAAP